MPLVDIVKLRGLVREWREEAAEYKRLAGVAERRHHDDENDMSARIYWNLADAVEERAQALEEIIGVEVRSERP